MIFIDEYLMKRNEHKYGEIFLSSIPSCHDILDRDLNIRRAPWQAHC